MKKQIIFLTFFILLLDSNTFAFYSYFSKQLSFYYGQTYRVEDKFYHLFEIAYESHNHSCLSDKYRGYGLRLDYFDKGNFEIQPKYILSLLRRPDPIFNPYCSIIPVVFKISDKVGINVKPEIGIRLNTGIFTAIGASFNVSYGYNIPIASEKTYLIGRHDLAAKLALTINLDEFGSLFKKKSEDTNNEDNIETTE